ncbi:unnamed protein product [Cylicocyclus nassatus]|uniref:Uncharacterized protein n=1 Tax=Cylicocyclus nassatus TaxID=53992 RepID=A0AA36HHH6_CYLNA|nr:unnamed protein product [Cylicocyclus nassatus]
MRSSIVVSSSACSSTCLRTQPRPRRLLRPYLRLRNLHRPGTDQGVSVRGRLIGMALLLVPVLGTAATPVDCTQGLAAAAGLALRRGGGDHAAGARRCRVHARHVGRGAGRRAIYACSGRPQCPLRPDRHKLRATAGTTRPRSAPMRSSWGAATQRAATALQDNPTFRFSGPQLGWIGFGVKGAGGAGLAAHAQFRPRGSVRAECGVGRQVAQLATQRELYGDAAFDTEFKPAELSIGTFLALHDTDSILLVQAQVISSPMARPCAQSMMGRQAFVGVPGFIEHVVGEGAAQALALHGGLAWYDQRNAELWKLAQDIPRIGQRYFERLLFERDPDLRARLEPRYHDTLARMDQLLDDPFYQQFVIYVHPRGIRPVGYHVAPPA